MSTVQVDVQTPSNTDTTVSPDKNEQSVNDKVTVNYSNGSTYTGVLLENRYRNGVGVLRDSKSNQFEGLWINDQTHGQGVLKWNKDSASHDSYTGMFCDGLFHGTGTLKYRSGSYYTGEWKMGKRDGFGSVIWPNAQQSYTGDWREGYMHGTGKYLWKQSSREHAYIGEYRLGKRNGTGTFWYSDGSIYSGQWKDDQKHGQGTYISAQGHKLVGKWDRDMIAGMETSQEQDFHFDLATIGISPSMVSAEMATLNSIILRNRELLKDIYESISNNLFQPENTVGLKGLFDLMDVLDIDVNQKELSYADLEAKFNALIRDSVIDGDNVPLTYHNFLAFLVVASSLLFDEQESMSLSLNEFLHTFKDRLVNRDKSSNVGRNGSQNSEKFRQPACGRKTINAVSLIRQLMDEPGTDRTSAKLVQSLLTAMPTCGRIKKSTELTTHEFSRFEALVDPLSNRQ